MSDKILWNHDKIKPIGTITESISDGSYRGSVTYHYIEESEKPKDKKMKKKELLQAIYDHHEKESMILESLDSQIDRNLARIRNIEKDLYNRRFIHALYICLATAFGIVGAIYLFLHIIGAL